MYINLNALREAATKRPSGYLEECLSRGVVKGEYLEILPEDYYHLRTKYRSNPETKTFKGLGDVVALVAQPIAKTIDKVFHTNVAGCGGCKQRQQKLNELVPFNQS